MRTRRPKWLKEGIFVHVYGHGDQWWLVEKVRSTGWVELYCHHYANMNRRDAEKTIHMKWLRPKGTNLDGSIVVSPFLALDK